MIAPRRRLLLLVPFCLSLASATVFAAPARERPAEPDRWRITGRPVADGCGGEIVLAARHLRFLGGTMLADVVDRRYRYERRGDRRIAEGTFQADFACAGTQLYERWDLRHEGPDVLVGELSSTWHLEPSCEACTIRFRIRATRMR